MATISLADIELVSNTELELYIAAATLAAGELFYLDASDQAMLADNSASTTAVVAGIALQDATLGNYVAGVPNGATIEVSNVLVVGDSYILATTAGDVMTAGELLTTQYLTLIGTVSTTSRIVLDFNITGSVKA